MGPEHLRIFTDGIPLKVPDITSQGGTRLFTSAGLRREPGGRGEGVCQGNPCQQGRLVCWSIYAREHCGPWKDDATGAA